MSHWKTQSISSFCEKIYSGGTPNTKKTEYWGGNLKWLSSGETRNEYIFDTEKRITELGAKESSTRLAYSGDVVMASAGQGYTRGQVSMLKTDTFVNQSVIVFRTNSNELLSDYLYYNLSNRYDELRALSDSNSIRGSITTKLFNSMEISIPTLDIQKKIVDILRAIDEKIVNNKKINHHLEQIAQANFHEKFGNQVPNGILGDIASVSSGKRPPIKVSERTATEDIPILGAASIMGYTSKSLYSEKILVTGRVGTHGVIQRYNRPCWPSDNALVLKSDDYELVYQILLSMDFSGMNRGSTQPLITQTDLKNVSIYIPTQIELSDFEDTVGTIMQQYESNIVENESLVQLRDSLLPKLMSGELPVTD